MMTKMMMMMMMMIVRRRRIVTSLLVLLQRVFRRNARELEGLLTPNTRAIRSGHVNHFLSSLSEGEIEFQT